MPESDSPSSTPKSSPKAAPKSRGAFRTIGELAADTGLPQHILRYWETKFPQLRPLTRAGNRRYYRPEDVALVLRLNTLLNEQHYTIRGVQKLLAAEGRPRAVVADPLAELRAIRDALAAGLGEDGG